jgi:hypothetical protein
MGTETMSLEAERLQLIADRKKAFLRFALAGEVRRRMIHSEYIEPLNRRLVEINRRLGK